MSDINNTVCTSPSAAFRRIPDSLEIAGQTKARAAGKSDEKTMAKQIETVFLNELLRIMMEQTSFGQDRTVSTYLPAITSELSKSLAERGGIGLADFILKGNSLSQYKIGSSVERQASSAKGSKITRFNFLGNPPIY